MKLLCLIHITVKKVSKKNTHNNITNRFTDFSEELCNLYLKV